MARCQFGLTFQFLLRLFTIISHPPTLEIRNVNIRKPLLDLRDGIVVSRSVHDDEKVLFARSASHLDCDSGRLGFGRQSIEKIEKVEENFFSDL